MKILLLGEYSNVHWTLAEGLRALGHTVCVVSNGDFWKDYRRDISLVREYTKFGGIKYLLKLYTLLPKLRGYDIVQFINPMFLELKAERVAPVYRYIKKHNKKTFLGAFGMDAYWVEACTTKPHRFRYSDFNIGEKEKGGSSAEQIPNELSDFFDDRGNYKLDKFLDEAYQASVKNQFQKDFIEADEKVNLLYSAISGQILRIFPKMMC